MFFGGRGFIFFSSFVVFVCCQNNNGTDFDTSTQDFDTPTIIENSFRSSKNAELETFSLNIWYIVLGGVISVSFLFLLNLVLSQGVRITWFQCQCQSRQETRKKEGVTCYLCDKKVSKAQWADGSHRRNCANKKRIILDRMPRPLEVNCPNCIQVLRLWPSHLGEGFICDNAECRTPKDEILINSGYNRLNCFVCDYDICMACANRLVCLKQNGRRVKPNVSNTGLAARNWLIHMNPIARKSFESNHSNKSRESASGGGKKGDTATSAVLATLTLRRSSKHRKSSRRNSAASYPSRRSLSCKATPYARRGQGGEISTSAKSLPQPSIQRLDEEILLPSSGKNSDFLSVSPSNSSQRRYSRTIKRPPFNKAVSLDYDDGSHYTYCSNTSSKQTTIRIENDSHHFTEEADTSEDEDTDNALMMTASSEFSSGLEKIQRLRTVSTVSECSEFSTCH